MMTSKEKLKKLVEICFECDIMYYQEKFDEEIKLYCELEKDLEILEILKKVIKNNCFDVAMLDARPNEKTILSCEDYGITLKTEDYYKIVRWLNNDRTARIR